VRSRSYLARLLALALVVLVVLTACGGSSDQADEQPPAPPPSDAVDLPPEPEPPVEPEPPAEPDPPPPAEPDSPPAEPDPDARAAYIAEADVICAEIAAGFDMLPEPETFDDLVFISLEAQDLANLGLAQIDELSIPPGDEEAVEAVFGPLRVQIDVFRDLAEAAADGDEQAITDIVASGEALDAEAHDTALAYGFNECGIDDDLLAGEGTEASSGGADEPDTGDFILQYIPPEDPELEGAFTFLQESAVLDEIVQGVNDTIALREDVLVSVEEFPDNPGPAYYPEALAIVIPPEFLNLIADILTQAELVETQEELEAEASAIVAFVFLHEVGHALIDQLELPITGREEDAVDQLATVVVTDAEEGAGTIAVSAAALFGAFAANRESFEVADFWDEHSLDEQRFFNLLCWVYGADPSVYGEIADYGVGEDRLARCEEEFAQVRNSWETLLAPFLKTG
jgi:hypothetical protein